MHYAENVKKCKFSLYFSKAIKYNADSRNSQRRNKETKTMKKMYALLLALVLALTCLTSCDASSGSDLA